MVSKDRSSRSVLSSVIRSALIFCSLLSSLMMSAHEIRPAYLEIKEIEPTQYEIIWKVPLLNERIPDIQPIFENGIELEAYHSTGGMSALTTFMHLTTKGDIGGASLSIKNLSRTLIDVLVRIERSSGEVNTFLIQPSSPSAIIPSGSDRFQVAKTFGILGVEHILMGWDHLLFVLGLMLLINSRRLLITTITAFTIAHSITLILSSLGWVRLASAPVETVIALSIVFLGREYIMKMRGEPSLTAQRPWLIAFVFGLLHGFGFAGALADIGLPDHALGVSLLSFNLGVEVGQLLFVGALVIVAAIANRMVKSLLTPAIRILPGYLVGGMAAFWFIERLLDIVT